MSRRRRLLVLAAAVLVLVASLGSAASWYTGRSQSAEVPFTAIPDYAVAGYSFAEGHEHLLRGIPCYCGCTDLGHESLYQCFIRPRGGYDSHAANCNICIDEAAMAETLLAEGKTTAEIRAAIDAEFAQFGPPTKTP